MINLFINRKSPGKIDNLTLDVTINERHLYQNEVTSFPVEDGGRINDHVCRQPERLTMTGLVSNTPLWQGDGVTSYKESFRSSAVGQAFLKTGTRTDDALAALLRIAGRVYPVGPGMYSVRNGSVAPVTIVTGLMVYNDMVMTSLTIDRDAQTGDSLPFTVEFVHLKKVIPTIYKFWSAPVKEENKAKLSKKADVGKVTPVEAKPKTSVLAGMYNRLAGGK